MKKTAIKQHISRLFKEATISRTKTIRRDPSTAKPLRDPDTGLIVRDKNGDPVYDPSTAKILGTTSKKQHVSDTPIARVRERTRPELPEDWFWNITDPSDVQILNAQLEDMVYDSPFVGGSREFNRLYNSGQQYNYVKFTKWEHGVKKVFTIKVDPPDIREGDYVIIPKLYELGLFGVGQVLGVKHEKAYVFDEFYDEYKHVVVPLLFLRSVTPNSPIGSLTNVGKAFALKIAGARSEYRISEPNQKFVPKGSKSSKVVFSGMEKGSGNSAEKWEKEDLDEARIIDADSLRKVVRGFLAEAAQLYRGSPPAPGMGDAPPRILTKNVAFSWGKYKGRYENEPYMIEQGWETLGNIQRNNDPFTYQEKGDKALVVSGPESMRKAIGRLISLDSVIPWQEEIAPDKTAPIPAPPEVLDKSASVSSHSLLNDTLEAYKHMLDPKKANLVDTWPVFAPMRQKTMRELIMDGQLPKITDQFIKRNRSNWLSYVRQQQSEGKEVSFGDYARKTNTPPTQAFKDAITSASDPDGSKTRAASDSLIEILRTDALVADARDEYAKSN